MKDKENIVNNYNRMTVESWTYGRMTQEEKDKWNKLLETNRILETLKGTYNQRWEILNSIYYAYLLGIGYDSPNWRSTKEELETMPQF